MAQGAAMRILKTENRKLAVELLNIAESYQRTVVPSQVNRIAKNLDPDAFGSLTVGERRDGTFWVVDGFQRLTAAIKLGIASVPCDVFKSEGQEHEARVFRLKNKERTGVSAISLFRAQLVERDEQSVDIDAIVRNAGLRMRFESGPHGWPFVKAVVALEQSYGRVGPDGLAKVLGIICAAWSGESDALRGDIIGGLAHFLKRNPSPDINRLVDRLSKKSVVAVMRAADATFKLERDRDRSSSSSSKAICTCLAIEGLYFKGMRKRKRSSPTVEE